MTPVPQRGVLRAAAALLFAAVAALVFLVDDPVQATTVLFVVPIALLALTDGRRGGVGGAALASGVFVAWALSHDETGLTALGWIARLVAFAVIGTVVGHYRDLARSHERRRLAERYAAELDDRVVQSLVVARYALDDDSPATAPVDDALASARRMVSERLGEGEIEPGELRLHGEA